MGHYTEQGNNIELPPLPEHDGMIEDKWYGFRREAVQAYARSAIEPYAKRIAELEAALIAYASEFAPDEDGEPDVGRIHENIRKLKADRKRGGSIVNNASASSEPYAQLIVVNEDDEWPQLVYLKGVDLEPGVHDLFLSPQPLSGSDIPTEPDTATIADYEEVLADHRRLVRELDVLLNGEEGAAKQASLCDIVAQVRREGIKTAEPVVWPENPPQRKGQSPVLFDDGYDEGWAKCLEACKASVQNAQPAEPVKPSRDWTEDASHDNGNYQCKCVHCGEFFVGHKRRVTCKVCSEPVKVPSDAEIMAEVYAVCPDFDSAHEGIDEYQVVSAFRALLVRYSQSIHRDKYREAYMEWTDKTGFIQQWVSEGKLPVKYLGWHRADVMRDLIENAEEMSNLKDKFEEAFTGLREDILYSRVADNMENYQTNAILDALDEMYERVFEEEEK